MRERNVSAFSLKNATFLAFIMIYIGFLRNREEVWPVAFDAGADQRGAAAVTPAETGR